jgi:hypothetical protein
MVCLIQLVLFGGVGRGGKWGPKPKSRNAPPVKSDGSITHQIAPRLRCVGNTLYIANKAGFLPISDLVQLILFNNLLFQLEANYIYIICGLFNDADRSSDCTLITVVQGYRFFSVQPCLSSETKTTAYFSILRELIKYMIPPRFRNEHKIVYSDISWTYLHILSEICYFVTEKFKANVRCVI